MLSCVVFSCMSCINNLSLHNTTITISGKLPKTSAASLKIALQHAIWFISMRKPDMLHEHRHRWEIH